MGLSGGERIWIMSSRFASILDLIDGQTDRQTDRQSFSTANTARVKIHDLSQTFFK